MSAMLSPKARSAAFKVRSSVASGNTIRWRLALARSIIPWINLFLDFLCYLFRCKFNDFLIIYLEKIVLFFQASGLLDNLTIRDFVG